MRARASPIPQVLIKLGLQEVSRQRQAGAAKYLFLERVLLCNPLAVERRQLEAKPLRTSAPLSFEISIYF